MDERAWPPDIDFAAVFGALPGATAVLAADPHFTVLAVNDAMLDVVQRPREAIVGRPLAEAFANASAADPQASDVAELRESLAAVLRSRTPQPLNRQRYER